MPDFYLSPTEQLRAEIAAAAARMIAEDGADYGSAKRRALKQILGNQKVRGEIMPDNEQIEEEVRIYQALFFADTQPARLLHLRHAALRLMHELERFHPYVTGAVWNGTAGDHSDIYLQLFTDSAKEVEIFLLGKNIQFEVGETPHFRHGKPVETLSLLLAQRGAPPEVAHLAVYDEDDLRSAPRQADKRPERGDAAALARLIDDGSTADEEKQEEEKSMKKLQYLPLLVVVAIIGIGLGMYANHRITPAASPETQALDRLLSQTLPDVSGQAQSLAQWKGKPLIVNFWATWCGPCVEEMPELMALEKEIAPIQVLGIGVDSQKNIAEFAEKWQIRYPLYVAGTDATDLLRQFGNQAGGLPFTALVGKDGTVKKVYLGRLKFDELRQDLSKLL